MKSTPIYVKPQLTSGAGTCRIDVLVGIRIDPGKTIDSITVQFQLPHCILSADMTSNHGTVNILANKVPKCFHCDIFGVNTKYWSFCLSFWRADSILHFCLMFCSLYTYMRKATMLSWNMRICISDSLLLHGMILAV